MAHTPSIQSLDRGLMLLIAVANARRPLALPELTEVLGIDRSSVFRLANTLRRKGFLAQSPRDKAYALGPTILQLAGAIQSAGSLVQLAHSHLLQLAAETHETAHLGVRQERHVVFLDTAPSDQPVSVVSRCGQTAPLHCTALGKALLGDFDRRQIDQLYSPGTTLSAETPRTARSLGQLAAQCKRIRARGYAVDDQEYDKGVRCLAAGIRDARGQIIAAVGISAPASRLPKRRMAKTAQIVLRTACQISATLGHNDASRDQEC